MSLDLPKQHFEKATKHLKKYNSTLWYLFWKGKNFIEGDTLYFNLWLINIRDNKYPVTFDYNTKIQVKALSAGINKYILGSIYDYQGTLINTPEVDSYGIQEVNVLISNSFLETKGFFNILKNSNYPLIDYRYDELKNVLYYQKNSIINGREIKVLIPLQLMIDFFFFSFSTKLNNLIISNSIPSCVNNLGSKNINGVETGMISQNRLEVDEKEALYYGRFFFTKEDCSLKAIDLLRLWHLKSFKKGDRKTYFKSKIPFDFDANFKIIGQYISSSTFLANRVVGIECNEPSFFNIDKLIVSVLNDTRKASNYQDESASINFNSINNRYSRIESNNDYDNSDQTNELHKIIENEPKNYSFNFIPKSEILPKDTNRNKYVLDQILQGKEYTGGSINMFGDTNNYNVVKTNIEISIYDLIEWNDLIKSVLIDICDEKNYEGYFINSADFKSEISYKKYVKNNDLNVLCPVPYGSNVYFKFILFRVTYNNKSYYYFDKGAGTHSCFFSDIHHNKIETSRLIKFIRRMIVDENLRWSKVRISDKYKSDGFIIYQPIEHKESNLKIRLLKRLVF